MNKEQDGSFLRALWNLLIYTQKQPDEERYNAYIEDMCTQRNLVDVYQALNLFNISNVHNGIVEGTGEARNIDVPVLVLRGSKDLVVTERMTMEIMEDLGECARLVYLEGCGHSPLVDDIEQLTERVSEFIDS